MKNIVFIGMPGSGKSTVSQLLAQALGRPWFDCDTEIERLSGKSVSAIFSEHGEEHFRNLETECLKSLINGDGTVIAAGGGAVLRNAKLLGENSTVVYLQRSIPDILGSLAEDESRPLLASQKEESLKALYEERKSLYEASCDIAVLNDSTIEACVQKVLEGINEVSSN
ncbi:MAG: shikimate kinase [Eubacteriaceae bacterium]|jgi:shikimate kinase|nr:shikimate kinase [Eubacteriaceae bacterium]